MANRRWRWYLGLLVGLILIPPILWVLVVVVAPTGWAKGKVVAILESRSGRRVGLEGLSVRLLGGIRLTNLEIGSPHEVGTPWLKAADIRLDVGPFQMIRGRFRPTHVEVDGVDLRILRRADGTVELADLIQPVPVPAIPSSAEIPGRRIGSPCKSIMPTSPSSTIRLRRASISRMSRGRDTPKGLGSSSTR